MITLKEYIEENEIEEKISADQAFEEGQRHVARNIAFMFGICIDHANEDRFLTAISEEEQEMTKEKLKKKVYISGQITGLPEKEYKKLFDSAEDILTTFGYDPINPLLLDETDTKNWSWHDYMKRDIKLLCDCDYIYLLPNWRNSKGAMFEYMVADMLQIPCLNLQDIQEATK